MKTLRQPKVTDLMSHYELLLLFRKYVDQCIEDFDEFRNKLRPFSFDEWYNSEYLPNIESLTQVVRLELSWYLGRYQKETIHCRIPAETVGDDNGGIFDEETLQRVAKALARKENHPETFINYRGACVYRWSADI